MAVSDGDVVVWMELSLSRGPVLGSRLDANAVAEVRKGLIVLCPAGCDAASDADVVGRSAGPVPILPLSGPLSEGPKLAGVLVPLPG